MGIYGEGMFVGLGVRNIIEVSDCCALVVGAGDGLNSYILAMKDVTVDWMVWGMAATKVVFICGEYTVKIVLPA